MHRMSRTFSNTNAGKSGAIRSGRNAVRQSRPGNALVRQLSVLFVSSVLTAAGFGLYASLPYINPAIEHIVVQGEMLRVDQSSLSRAVYANPGGGILMLDIEYLRAEIAKIAWVESVEIVKHFPSTLAVHIVEERAVAQWNDQGYISHTGEFIESAPHADLIELPLLTSLIAGVEPGQGAAEAIEIFHRLNSRVLMCSQNIQELRQGATGGWTMIWDNGLSVDLGRVDHLNRTRHAMSAWQRLPADVKSNIDRIDARYENGVAIRPRSQAVANNLARLI